MRLKENNKNSNDSCQVFSSAPLLLRGERRSRRTMNTRGVVRGSECPIKRTKQSETYFQQDQFKCIEQGTYEHMTFAVSWGGHNASFKCFLFTQLEGGINFNGKSVQRVMSKVTIFWTTSLSFVQMSSIQTKPTRCINSTAPLFCQHNHYSRACFKPELHKYIFFKVKEHFLQV